jgi:hypothetical protein
MRSDGAAMTPSGYNIKEITIAAVDGSNSLDIKNIVTSLSFVESLYSPTVICRISIQDSVNLVETFPLIGQEKIKIILERQDHDSEEDPKRIKLNLIVTEYPLYGKDDQRPNVSAITINAISQHAYVMSLNEVTRSFDGPLIEEIEKLLTESGIEEKNMEMATDNITAAKGIIPRQKSIHALEWFRSRTVNGTESPLYVYQTIDGKIHLKFYSDLIVEKVYGKYEDARFYSFNAQSFDDYKQRARRILSCASNLRFGKLFQSQAGAYASSMETVDIAKKIANTKDYGYNIEEMRRIGNQPFTAQAIIQDKSLNERYDARTSRVSLNSLAFGDQDTGGSMNTNQLRASYEQKNRSFTECLETMTHEIKIYGDYEFNPGKMIDITFPKSIDPQANDDEDYVDKSMSGKYIVTAVTHTFTKGEYYINARVKRDSLGIEV